MFDSKSPVVKIVGYAIIGFFLLIIIISFGMPDFISRMSMDKSVAAVVNGQKVSRYDLLRFRDMKFGQRAQVNEDRVLNYYIGEVLLLQQAAKTGFSPSEERISEHIRNIPGIKDPDTGKVNPEMLQRVLQYNRSSLEDLYYLIKKEMMKEDFLEFMKLGVSFPSDEIKSEYLYNNSRIQVRYAFASNIDLKKRFKNQIAVSEGEIADEMQKNKKEAKDPSTDRERVRIKIEDKKFSELKNKLVGQINSLAIAKRPFDEANGLLGGNIAVSGIFKIGEQPVDEAKNREPLTSVSNSSVFIEDFLAMENGSSSRVIETPSGLYIFTPILKDIRAGDIPAAEIEPLTRNLENENFTNLRINLMNKIQENSKITKNIKADKADQ